MTVYIPASFPDRVRDMIKDQGAVYLDVSEARKIAEGIFCTGLLNGPPEGKETEKGKEEKKE